MHQTLPDISTDDNLLGTRIAYEVVNAFGRSFKPF